MSENRIHVNPILLRAELRHLSIQEKADLLAGAAIDFHDYARQQNIRYSTNNGSFRKLEGR